MHWECLTKRNGFTTHNWQNGEKNSVVHSVVEPSTTPKRSWSSSHMLGSAEGISGSTTTKQQNGLAATPCSPHADWMFGYTFSNLYHPVFKYAWRFRRFPTILFAYFFEENHGFSNQNTVENGVEVTFFRIPKECVYVYDI